MGDADKCYFLAIDDLGDTPNIIVGGSGNSATEITPSHWPKSGDYEPMWREEDQALDRRPYAFLKTGLRARCIALHS